MKQQIENIIKKNLPEKKEITCDLPDIIKMCEKCKDDTIFNQVLSQINTSLIADEVLKVVMNKEIKGIYRGKPVEEMAKEELIEALENISNLYQQFLLTKFK